MTADALELGERVGASLSLLAAAMRARGARVGVGDLLTAQRALVHVDAASRRQSYLALRAALCSRHEDLETFDAAFEQVFAAEPAPSADPEPLPAVAFPPAPPPAPPGGDDRDDDDDAVVPAAYSEVELLRKIDFAAYSDAERARARALIARLGTRGPLRRSRRMRPVAGRGERLDVRATLRASLRHGGEPLRPRGRAATPRPRPLVLVCDVSGSMQDYARMWIQYMHACVASRRRVEAFAFGTRLTRITRELRRRDPDDALAHAAGAVADWSGGTRIGESLARLNRVHGGRVGRGAVVVLLSDGWDRGDPDQLSREMARLRRCAHRVMWLNPLKADPGYEPLTRGMVAALPHVDAFLAGNSIASLEDLAALLESDV